MLYIKNKVKDARERDDELAGRRESEREAVRTRIFAVEFLIPRFGSPTASLP